MKRVFVNTSAFVASSYHDDRHHNDAVALLERSVHEQFQLVTTNFVIAETHGVLLIRTGRNIAARFLEELRKSTTTIIRVSAQDEQRAQEIIVSYTDKDFSYTDCTSFVIMERLHIRLVFSFDQHFAQYGFELLRSH